MSDPEIPAPAYGEAAPLPPYTDSPAVAAPAVAAPAAAPQKIWFQSIDTTGLYRRRLILPASPASPAPPAPPDLYGASSSSSTPPPDYSAHQQALYTVKHHSHHSSTSPRGSMSAKALRQVDFTVFLGPGDDGAVVATGLFHNHKLQRGIGELRFFPRTGSSAAAAVSSESAPTTEDIVLTEAAPKKYAFDRAGVQLHWEETGPGEQRPEPAAPPPPPPPPPAPPAGFLGKLKNLVSSPPRTPPLTQPPKKTIALRLVRADTGAVVARYTELQPIASAEFVYRHVVAGFKDGHEGVLEVYGEREEGGCGVEVAVVTAVMVLERVRREVVKQRSRGWGGVAGVGGSSGGGGGM